MLLGDALVIIHDLYYKAKKMWESDCWVDLPILPRGTGTVASALSLTNLTLKSKTILISLFMFILNFQCSIQNGFQEGVGNGGGHKSEPRDLPKSQGVQGAPKGRESRGFNNLDTMFEVEV